MTYQMNYTDHDAEHSDVTVGSDNPQPIIRYVEMPRRRLEIPAIPKDIDGICPWSGGSVQCRNVGAGLASPVHTDGSLRGQR